MKLYDGVVSCLCLACFYSSDKCAMMYFLAAERCSDKTEFCLVEWEGRCLCDVPIDNGVGVS